MKYLVLLVLLLGGPVWRLLTWVRDRNQAVAIGTAAYKQGAASRAATAFAAALATQPRRAPDPRLLLNLAHAQTRAGQLSPAHATYDRLLAGSPAGLGSVARQQLAVQASQHGNVAQALSLLQQALLLDPKNSGARYNYEVLSDYLARRPNSPQIAPPPPASAPGKPKPSPEKNSAEKNQPAEKTGNDRKGEIDDQKPAPGNPTAPPEHRPNVAGQPDDQRPANISGNAAKGGRAPAGGPPQPLAAGPTAGTERGLNLNSESPGPAANGRSKIPGTEAAAPTDLRLQTQRERLQAMNLSPTQARQILETLRAQEQQYLQQLTRPSQQKPDPNKPTW